MFPYTSIPDCFKVFDKLKTMSPERTNTESRAVNSSSFVCACAVESDQLKAKRNTIFCIFCMAFMLTRAKMSNSNIDDLF